jgi:hypothetical protein
MAYYGDVDALESVFAIIAEKFVGINAAERDFAGGFDALERDGW